MSKLQRINAAMRRAKEGILEMPGISVEVSHGCSFSCRFCHPGKRRPYAVTPREVFIQQVQDATQKKGHCIMLCQGSEPGQSNQTMELVEEGLQLTLKARYPVVLHTRAGTRMARFFPLLEQIPGSCLSTSLPFSNQDDSNYWEGGRGLD